MDYQLVMGEACLHPWMFKTGGIAEKEKTIPSSACAESPVA